MSLVEKLADKKVDLTFWKAERKKLGSIEEIEKGGGISKFRSKYDLGHIMNNIRQLEDEIALIEFNSSTSGGC